MFRWFRVHVLLVATGVLFLSYHLLDSVLNIPIHDEGPQDPKYDPRRILSRSKKAMAPKVFQGYKRSVGEDVQETGSCTEWMLNNKDSLSGKTLDDITIPGTHDTGAYDMNSHIMPGSLPERVIKLLKWLKKLRLAPSSYLVKWAECQSESVSKQLNGGIRFLDLRAGWNRTHWVSVHTVQGPEMRELFQEIKDFLDSTTHEIIIAELYHIYNADQDQKIALAQTITDMLGPYLVPCCFDDIWSKPVDWYWKTNRRLVMVTTLPCLPSDEWSSDALALFPPASDRVVCPWYYKRSVTNTYANSDNLNTMWAYNEGVLDEFERDGNALLKMSWTMTPQVRTLIHGIFRAPRSLIALANKANEALPEFVEQEMAQGQPFPQIMIADEFETSNIVPLTNRVNGLPECSGSGTS